MKLTAKESVARSDHWFGCGLIGLSELDVLRGSSTIFNIAESGARREE